MVSLECGRLAVSHRPRERLYATATLTSDHLIAEMLVVL